MFVLFSAGNFENFLRSLSEVPPPSDPASAPAMASLCAHYGIGFGPGSASATVSAPFEPSHVAGEQGHFFELGDHRGWGKVSSTQNGGTFLLVETEADPNGGVPPHIHSREEETFFILSGRFALMIDGRMIEAGPGDTVFAPRNRMHAWRCISETPGRFLLLITPGANFEAFAAEMAMKAVVPAEAMENAAVAAEFMEITSRYGIEMLPAIK
jgi:quercetin dioxygenase-like cupin family protein